jgi:hypothetical protein
VFSAVSISVSVVPVVIAVAHRDLAEQPIVFLVDPRGKEEGVGVRAVLAVAEGDAPQAGSVVRGFPARGEERTDGRKDEQE